MNTNFFHAVIVVTVLAAFPTSHAVAATFIAPEGESASLRSETPGDVYAASHAVVIAAPVHGDIFAAGDSVDISGSSTQSIFAVGRSVVVSGSSGDDVRVAGSSISLTSHTTHDVFAAGSSVFLGPESSIGEDAYLTGSDITIAGTIQGTVRVAGEHVLIAKTAVITGDLITYNNKPIIEDGAKIAGNITTTIPPIAHEQAGRQNIIARLLKSVASYALLALVLLLAAPLFTKTAIEQATSSPTHSGFLGLAIMILCLPIALILAITGIGMYVAGLVLTISLFLIMLGIGYSQLLLGSLIGKQIWKKDLSITWKHALLGSFATSIIGLAGWVGPVFLFGIFLVGLGASVKTLKHIVYA